MAFFMLTSVRDCVNCSPNKTSMRRKKHDEQQLLKCSFPHFSDSEFFVHQLLFVFFFWQDNRNDGAMSANHEVSLNTVEDKIASQQPNCFKVAAADPVCGCLFSSLSTHTEFHAENATLTVLTIAQRFAPFVTMPDCIPAKKPRESIDLAVLSPLWLQFMAWQQLGVVC